jgi:hypothetical protein
MNYRKGVVVFVLPSGLLFAGVCGLDLPRVLALPGRKTLGLDVGRGLTGSFTGIAV